MNNMNKRGQIAIFVVLALILVGGIIVFFAIPDKEISTGSCTSDSDCVPASCCHPNSCVAKAQAPQCEGRVCSEVCEPDTLDCDQKRCACMNNQCSTVSKLY